MRKFLPWLSVMAIVIAVGAAIAFWAESRQQAAIARIVELRPDQRPKSQQDRELLASWIDEVKSHPDDPVAWNNLAGMLFNLNAFVQAEKAYQKSLEIDSAQAVIWALMGEARVRQGKESDPVSMTALFAFNQALRLDPANLRAHFYISLADFNDGKRDRAISRMRYVMEASGEDSMAFRAAQQTLAEWSSVTELGEDADNPS